MGTVKLGAEQAALRARGRKRRRLIARVTGLAFGCILVWGCRSVPTPNAEQKSATPVAPINVRPATVLTNTPTHPRRFTTWQKLNPVWWFGNADEPVAPDWYRPGQSCRDFRWHLRNPCHNFTFFVMGIADKPHTRVGRYPDENFCPGDGWNWAVCRYKCLRLPFVSYHRGGFKVYCGWRNRGHFGMKINLAGQPEVPRPK